MDRRNFLRLGAASAVAPSMITTATSPPTELVDRVITVDDYILDRHGAVALADRVIAIANLTPGDVAEIHLRTDGVAVLECLNRSPGTPRYYQREVRYT